MVLIKFSISGYLQIINTTVIDQIIYFKWGLNYEKFVKIQFHLNDFIVNKIFIINILKNIFLLNKILNETISE